MATFPKTRASLYLATANFKDASLISDVIFFNKLYKNSVSNPPTGGMILK